MLVRDERDTWNSVESTECSLTEGVSALKSTGVEINSLSGVDLPRNVALAWCNARQKMHCMCALIANRGRKSITGPLHVSQNQTAPMVKKMI